MEQVSCTVPLALTISQRLGIHAEAAYGQMSRRSWGRARMGFDKQMTKRIEEDLIFS